MNNNMLYLHHNESAPERSLGYALQHMLDGQHTISVYSIEDFVVSPSKIYSLLIVPFNSEIYAPTGLNLIREYRRKYKDYITPVLFFITSKYAEPNVFEPFTIRDPFINALLGNTEFGDTDKAVLFAELIYANKEDKKTDLLNFIEVSCHHNFREYTIEKINNIISVARCSRNDKINLLHKYYETFIYYYDYSKMSACVSEKEVLNAFNDSYEYYCNLNGIESNSHNVGKEIFKAPLPFILINLIHAQNELYKLVNTSDSSGDKKIKLLLIDNNPTRKKEALIKLFEQYGLSNIINFDIADLVELKDNSSIKSLYNSHVKNTHFVLLDFFLNTNNTYLAFNFISDMTRIKNLSQENLATTWYFITSSVYDSVTQYAQSGLLAENYESTVVDSGDDPTNDRRQIIFMYKLISYIKSRLTTYEKYWKNIRSVFECECYGQGDCGKNCTDKIQLSIRKYLSEFDNLSKLFYDDTQGKRVEDLVNLIDDTIRTFNVLPEADWQVIQHQIEQIDSIVREIDLIKIKGKFNCKYIKNEIRTRSQIY